MTLTMARNILRQRGNKNNRKKSLQLFIETSSLKLHPVAKRIEMEPYFQENKERGFSLEDGSPENFSGLLFISNIPSLILKRQEAATTFHTSVQPQQNVTRILTPAVLHALIETNIEIKSPEKRKRYILTLVYGS